MKVMLLAAGRGDRMQPLTWTLPKPAIPVLGRPFAPQILRRLAGQGFTRAVANLHHLPHVLEAMLGDGTETGLDELHYSREPVLLGTAGGLREAAHFLRGSGPILVRNSDFLADVDTGELLARHRGSGNLATLVLAPARKPFTEILVDSSGRIRSFGGTPPFPDADVAGRYLFTGMHVIEEELLDRIPAEGPRDIVREVYAGVAAEGRLGSYVHERFWWEFGAPRSYLEGSLALLRLGSEVRESVAETDPIRTGAGFVAAVGQGAECHGGVQLRGGVAIGAGTVVEGDCRVEDTVLLGGARIGPGTELRRCVVGPGASLASGTRETDALICADPDPDRDPDFRVDRRNGLLIRPL